MKAFLFLLGTGDMVAVRSENLNDAVLLMDGEGRGDPTEIRADVADAMLIPSKRGLYRNSVWRWVLGPTNLLGELPSDQN